MNRFARAKVKLQRVTGYVSIATFLVVMYSLVRDLYASPSLQWHPGFLVFAALLFGVALFLLLVLAELDWHYVFGQEQAESNVKNPLMYPMVYWSAWMLTHSSHHPDIEARLRDAFRAMGAEQLFNDLLKELAP